jgi:16S rRNA (cytosine967-C5)-methyltransferase
LKPEDLTRLKKKQLAILENASKSLKVGGTIVYSTCSIEKDENEDVVREFLALRSEFIVSKPKLPEVFVTKDGFVRTLTYRDNMDGFFAAVLERGSGSPLKMKK